MWPFCATSFILSISIGKDVLNYLGLLNAKQSRILWNWINIWVFRIYSLEQFKLANTGYGHGTVGHPWGHEVESINGEEVISSETKDEKNPWYEDGTRTSNVPCSNNQRRDITSYLKVLHSLGKIDVECRHCGTLHLIWRSEPFLRRGMRKWLYKWGKCSDVSGIVSLLHGSKVSGRGFREGFTGNMGSPSESLKQWIHWGYRYLTVNDRERRRK